jgi:Helix-turn-helix domain
MWVANPAVMPDHYQGDVKRNGDCSYREVHVAETLKKGTRVTGVDRSKLATTLGKRYDSGESIRSLAASTGRSYGFVHRILTETGVTLRGRGGATRSSRTKVKR